jgi:hypothetical protein
MSIVLKLEKTGRVIVFDRGYVTFDLIERIHKEGFCIIGTIKKYQYLPLEHFSKVKLNSGELSWCMKENPPVIATCWSDSSPQVISVSTF